MSIGIGHTRRAEPAAEPAEWRQVTSWRFERLVAAGFPAGLADALASSGDYDLHALLDLVDRGCPPVLAARIVAPVDVVEEVP